MCVVGGEYCDCSCHTIGAMHIVACCHICPTCNQNITFWAYDDHERKCKVLFNDINASHIPLDK